MATANSTAVNSSNLSFIGTVRVLWIEVFSNPFQLFDGLPVDHSNHDKNSDQPLPEEKIFKDDELVGMIDPILATDDKNQDGFIDYPEFVLAQQAAQARGGSP